MERDYDLQSALRKIRGKAKLSRGWADPRAQEIRPAHPEPRAAFRDLRHSSQETLQRWVNCKHVTSPALFAAEFLDRRRENGRKAQDVHNTPRGIY